MSICSSTTLDHLTMAAFTSSSPGRKKMMKLMHRPPSRCSTMPRSVTTSATPAVAATKAAVKPTDTTRSMALPSGTHAAVRCSKPARAGWWVSGQEPYTMSATNPRAT